MLGSALAPHPIPIETKEKAPLKNWFKTYGTLDSHVVPHHSTDKALSSLTLQIERDAVLLAWYGRRCQNLIDDRIYIHIYIYHL